jgi:uncharacterized membrane protein YeiH
VPVIFQGDLYAIPALAGSTLAAVVAVNDMPPALFIVASGVCLIWRLAAVTRGWSAPGPLGSDHPRTNI